MIEATEKVCEWADRVNDLTIKYRWKISIAFTLLSGFLLYLGTESIAAVLTVWLICLIFLGTINVEYFVLMILWITILWWALSIASLIDIGQQRFRFFQKKNKIGICVIITNISFLSLAAFIIY